MKTKSQIASEKFLEGYNCAQAVFYCFCDDLGFDKNAALKLATGLGGGMGRKQEVCGAVTGGIIVLGAKHGRGENADRSATELTYKKTRELMDRFAAKHGTFVCRQLLGGCDLPSDEGQQRYKENDLFNKVCRPCVETVVEILEAIIDE